MKINLDKSRKYILGCSSGPDSMALFHLLLESGYDFVVCNIDYNYRENSVEETDLVRDYCKENNIQFFTKEVVFADFFGNFEGWARRIRYDYFLEIGKKLDIKDVVVAHQQDDLIETYLMQKERGGLVSYYGLNASYSYKEFIIHRPLLDYTKKDTTNYCNEKKVPYILDPTNSDTTYKRNYYRHTVIDNLTLEDRKNILNEITLSNQNINNSYEKIVKMINLDTSITKENFLSLSLIEGQMALSIILDNWGLFFPISQGLIKDIQEAIKKKAPRYKVKFNDAISFVFDHDSISLINDNLTYEIKMENGKFNENIIMLNESSSRVQEMKKLGNLTIKPAKPARFYKINGVTKKINRIYIDYKMPQTLRNIWPGVFDENDNLLYIPRYRESFEVTPESVLLFDLHNLIKFIEKKNVLL